MNILYIGYWGANEGLSQSTIMPHLQILLDLGIEKLLYVSIERDNGKDFNIPEDSRLTHIPIYADKYGNRILNKLYDFVLVPKKIIGLAKKESINFVICRSSLAGFYGMKIKSKLSIPFMVESFEPHSQYMLDAGVWSRFNISFILSKRWESLQKKKANYIVTVSQNYRNQLISEKIDPNKILVAPCAVNLESFKRNNNLRVQLRHRIGATNNTIIGVYTGKFGGIYLEDYAFELFWVANQSFEDFKLIVLSPSSKKEIIQKLLSKGFSEKDFLVDKVPLDEISGYLSAADFAFSLHKSTESAKYFSPIKNGEYWAAGLPILVPEGVGDDEKIINEEGGGAIIDTKDIHVSFDKIKQLLGEQSTPVKLANKHRSFSTIKKIYEHAISLYRS